MSTCAHCGSALPNPGVAAAAFCCRGCEAAHALLRGMGLSSYYARRSVDPLVRPLRPEEGAVDVSTHAAVDADGLATLHLMVEGIHCAACVWLIESVLARQPGVTQARVNMTTRRLTLRWRAAEAEANAVVAPVLAVGYRLVPYDPARLGQEGAQAEKELLRAMAVAGFAASNVMLFSVSVWAGHDGSMGPATRTFMHWLSAMIALPAVVYCIRPFLRSALAALRHLRSNMDVPITIGVTITSGMSLWETIQQAEHAYFDSGITLLFFLLVGRYLDSRARGRARSAAEHLLSLGAVAVTVVEADGSRVLLAPDKVAPGMVVLVAAGERVGVDGTVADGVSDCDTSLITGETMPAVVRPGSQVFAGTLNVSAAVKVVVSAVGERTLLAEIVRMMEVAEQGRAKYVALADRVARYYSPVVHLTALATFLGWVLGRGAPWESSLMTAVAVLIITCPCALALAVPVVQVVSSGRLLRQGILLKSASALERLATVDTVVFDKTGTLTQGHAELVAADADWTAMDLALAATLAAASRHPLARAVVRAAPLAAAADGVVETPGAGLEDRHGVRLGSRAWCGVAESDAVAVGPELWLRRPGAPAVRFAFTDAPRVDAADTIAALKAMGLAVELLSGDRAPTVAMVAGQLGIDRFQAACTPAQKCQRLAELSAQGRRVLMVGDGLNDAPALASAHVSVSPSTAVDVSQTAADVVFQGERLWPVAEILSVARTADRLVKQNFGMAFLYNLITVPMAIAGLVTPLIAAVAMSSSSLVVISNALRLAGRRGR